MAANEDGKIVADGFFDREEDPRYQEDIKKYFADRGIEYRRTEDNMEKPDDQKVYPFGLRHASEHNEIILYCRSRRLNIECRKQLEKAFGRHSGLYGPDPYAFLPAVEAYGTDRVAFILSVTILLEKEGDAFPHTVLEWAQKQTMDMEDVSCREDWNYVINSSPDLLKTYVRLFQIYLQDRKIEEIIQIIEPQTG